MTDPGLTLIAALFDRSGSMCTIREDMEGAWRQLLTDQAALPGRLLVSVAQFDYSYDDVYSMVPAEQAKEFRIEPRGGTALVDGMGRFITTVGTQLSAIPENMRPGKVVVVIVTDGQENASREWNDEQVRTLITQQRDTYSWEFLFLGANMDAVKVGARYGLHRGQTSTYSPDRAGTYSVMANASRKITTFRGAGEVSNSPIIITAAGGGGGGGGTLSPGDDGTSGVLCGN